MIATSAKVGTTQMITINEIRKLSIPANAPRAEFWSAPSTVLMSRTHGQSTKGGENKR